MVAVFVWPFALALPLAKHVHTSEETGIVPAVSTALFAEGDNSNVSPVVLAAYRIVMSPVAVAPVIDTTFLVIGVAAAPPFNEQVPAAVQNAVPAAFVGIPLNIPPKALVVPLDALSATTGFKPEASTRPSVTRARTV